MWFNFEEDRLFVEDVFFLREDFFVCLGIIIFELNVICVGCFFGLCFDILVLVRIGVEGGGRLVFFFVLIFVCNILVILMILKKKYNKFVFIGWGKFNFIKERKKFFIF